MNSTLIETITRSIIEYTRDHMATKLITAIEEGTKLGKSTTAVVNEVFASLLNDIPCTSEPVPTTTKKATPKKASSEDAVKDGVLYDEADNKIICDAIKKSNNTRCGSGAKKVGGDGKYYCMVHIKSINKAQPDPSAKPKAKNTAAKIGTSTFTNALNGTTNGVTGKQAMSSSINTGDVDDIDQED